MAYHKVPAVTMARYSPPQSLKALFVGKFQLKGIPFWPQGNGEVERCIETLLKITRINTLEGKDWKKALQNFLFQYRATPHTGSDLYCPSVAPDGSTSQ